MVQFFKQKHCFFNFSKKLINSYQVSIKPSSDCLKAAPNDGNQATHHKLNDGVVWVVSSEQEGEAEVELTIANLNKDETYVVTVQTLNETVCGSTKNLELSTGSFGNPKQKKILMFICCILT